MKQKDQTVSDMTLSPFVPANNDDDGLDKMRALAQKENEVWHLRLHGRLGRLSVQ
jgi:hypothetical protein